MSKNSQPVPAKKEQAQQTTKQKAEAVARLAREKQIADLNAQLVAIVKEFAKTSQFIITNKTSSYMSLKYANRVLCELHIKNAKLSHVTFSQKQEDIVKILKENKLISRVVPASFLWPFDVECVVTPQLIAVLPQLLQLSVRPHIENQKLAEEKAKAKAEKEAKQDERGAKKQRVKVQA